MPAQFSSGSSSSAIARIELALPHLYEVKKVALIFLTVCFKWKKNWRRLQSIWKQMRKWTKSLKWQPARHWTLRSFHPEEWSTPTFTAQYCFSKRWDLGQCWSWRQSHYPIFHQQQGNVRVALGSFWEKAGVLGNRWRGRFRALVRPFQVRMQSPSHLNWYYQACLPSTQLVYRRLLFNKGAKNNGERNTSFINGAGATGMSYAKEWN